MIFPIGSSLDLLVRYEPSKSLLKFLLPYIIKSATRLLSLSGWTFEHGDTATAQELTANL